MAYTKRTARKSVRPPGSIKIKIGKPKRIVINPRTKKLYKVVEVYVKTDAIVVTSGSESESDSEEMHSPRSPSPRANFVAQENPPTDDYFGLDDLKQPLCPGPFSDSANSYEARCDSKSDDSGKSIHNTPPMDSPPWTMGVASNKGFHPTGSDKPGCNHQDPARPKYGKGKQLRKRKWTNASIYIDDQATEDNRGNYNYYD